MSAPIVVREDAPEWSEPLGLFGVWAAPSVPTIWMFGLPIEPGRKWRHMVLVTRPVRSKYVHAECMGKGKRCRAGTCKHAARVAATFERCRPVPRRDG